MKILFLANRVPYPPFRGDKLKIYNLAKRLCTKHELHLLTFAQCEEDFGYREELLKVFKTVTFVALPKWKSLLHAVSGVLDTSKPFQVHYFRSRTMSAALNTILKEQHFDVVHVQHLRMAQYLSENQDIPRILDLPDAFSLYWQRKQATTRNPLRRFFERWEQQRVLRYEQILKAYPQVLVCSKEDQAYLQQTHGLSHVDLLPNGVDTEVFAARGHDYSASQRVLFTGNMDYGPNIDAVVYFTEKILPIIRAAKPDIHFAIAGQRPVDKVLALANAYIEVTGFIPNLADEYAKAAVVVAPLRFGAGTQNKVLEALSMGVPVVCSAIGFEGLGIRSGEGAFMETDPQAFADRVIDLLASADLRRRTGEQGAALIAQKFSWDRIALSLESYFMQLVNSNKK